MYHHIISLNDLQFGKVQGALKGVISGGDSSSANEKDKDKQVKELERKISVLEKEVEDLKMKNFLLQESESLQPISLIARS